VLRFATALLAVLVVILSLAASPAGAQTPDPRASRIDSLFAPWSDPHGPGAAVAVVENGRIVLARGYGRATLEYDVPITPATVFHVASVSKQITAFALAMLADRGRISLDADVRTYLPELPDFGHTITPRQLIHHTSGIRDQWELLVMAGWRIDDVITRDQILSLMRHQQELNFAPGEEHLYSNMGYTLMAEIVERVTGQSFREWTHETIFEPLGMRSTHFHDDHEYVVPGRAYSYRPTPGGGYRHAVLSYANVGATSLFTTAEDLTRWIRNLETGEVGGHRVIARMRERGVLNNGDTLRYAFALSHDEHRGEPMLQHGGADAGFRSYLAWFPERSLGIVVLSNVASFDAGGMTRRVADVFLGHEPAPPPAARPAPAAVSLAAERLDEFVGTYLLGTGSLLSLERSGERLMLRMGAGQPSPVVAIGPDRFYLEPQETVISFIRDASTRVTGASLELRGGAVAASRLEPVAGLDLGHYQGDYHSPELGTTYSIVHRDGQLFAEHRRHPPSRLTLVEKDRFLGDRWGMGTLRFTRGADGELTGFELSGSRVRNVRFRRMAD
jgi:CubicO group peptidase (beta-lactamase class C family)